MVIERNKFLYYLFLFVVMLDSSIADTVIPEGIKDPFHTACLLLMILLTVIIIFIRKYSVKRIVIYVAVLLFGLYSYYCSKNTGYMISSILVLLTFGEDIDEVLTISFVVRLIVFAITVTLSLGGIVERGSLLLTGAEKGVLLGYGHSNVFAGNAGVLLMLYLAINRHRLTNLKLIIVTVVTILVFFLTGTRILLGLILMTVLLILCAKYFGWEKLMCVLASISVPAATIFNLGLVFFKSHGLADGIVDKIDRVFHGRIFLSAMNLSYYPVNLLGRNVDISLIASQNSYYALDNGYVYLLIYYGIVGLGITLLLMFIGSLRAAKNKEWVLCIIIFVSTIWMMYEGMMTSATTNIALLLAGGSFSLANNMEVLHNDT